MPHATRPSYFRSLSSYTARDKPRLFIALYPRGGGTSSNAGCKAYCDSCHWALVVGPATVTRKDPVTRYQLVHTAVSSPARRGSAVHAFQYEQTDTHEAPQLQDNALLYVAIAKVIDEERLSRILRTVSPPAAGDGYYTCFHWVREAFMALHEEAGALKSYFDVEDWPEVESCVREFYKYKRQAGRFAEDAGAGGWDRNAICTFNAWEKRATTP